MITPFSMDLNGNGITVSNAVWDEMKPTSAEKDPTARSCIRSKPMR